MIAPAPATRTVPATGPAGSAPAPPGDPALLAGALADAVRAVPGVAGLGANGPVEVATLYPGGKVLGVRLGDPVEVYVRLDRLPVGPVAARVITVARRVLATAGVDRPVMVTVVDVESSALDGGTGVG